MPYFAQTNPKSRRLNFLKIVSRALDSFLVLALVHKDEGENPRKTNRGPWSNMENSRYAYLDTVSVDVSSPNPNGISRSNSATSVIDSDYGGREGGVPLPSFGSNIGPLPQICLYYCPVSRSDMLYFTIAVTKSFLWLILVWGGDVWGPLFWWCLRHHPRPYSAPFSYPPPLVVQ